MYIVVLMCTYTSLLVCLYVYIYLYIHTHLFLHRYACYMYPCIFLCLCIYSCICTSMSTTLYTYIYIYMYLFVGVLGVPIITLYMYIYTCRPLYRTYQNYCICTSARQCTYFSSRYSHLQNHILSYRSIYIYVSTCSYPVSFSVYVYMYIAQ